jgi:hypothetical protein
VVLKIETSFIANAVDDSPLIFITFISSGYRKIPGNLCKGGSSIDQPQKIYCKEGSKDDALVILMWVFFLTVLIYVIYTFMFLFRRDSDSLDGCMSKMESCIPDSYNALISYLKKNKEAREKGLKEVPQEDYDSEEDDLEHKVKKYEKKKKGASSRRGVKSLWNK